MYSSIFFGSDINSHAEPASLVNRYEFNMILSYFRMQIFLKCNEISLAKQVIFKFRVLKL
jgi:hypothetical protein